MKLRKSVRGLTFSPETMDVGDRFRYVIDVKKKEVMIIPDDNGPSTVSRKKSGNRYKPLIDIRTKEVKELVTDCDYIEVTSSEAGLVARCIREVSENVICLQDILDRKVVEIGDVLGIETGQILLASGGTYHGYSYRPRPSVADQNYIDYLVRNLPPRFRKGGKEYRKLQNVYKAMSLFSGAGLLDYSFRDVRIRFVYGVDFDENACETYRHNIGEHIVCKDIRTVSPDEIPDVDLCIGGPCCQGYSNANRCNENSAVAKAKRLLIDDYIRLVKAKRPKVFVIENVPQLLTKEEGLYIKRVFDELGDYEIEASVVADDEVGGYTLRKRAIVIGSLIGKIMLPKIGLITKKTVRQALSKVDQTWFNWDDVTLPRESTRECMSYVPQGGNWKDIPESVHKFGPSTQSNTYRRLALDEVSPTITNWRKCILIHPTEDRILNVSEAAALMGLDKDFRIYGKTLDSRQQQIGNGVTQAIGRYVKEAVLKALDRNMLAEKNNIYRPCQA